MLKKLIAFWLIAVCLAFGVERAPADGFGAWGFIQTSNVTRTTPTIPTFTPGTNVAFIPRSQTPIDPSTSQDGPRCLDATWGAGCDVANQRCIAPTSGTPLESCQAPLQLTTGTGTGNGTVATINYISQTSFTYAVTQPLIISGATQANWNTSDVHLSSHFVTSASDAACPSSGPSIEVGFVGAPLAAAPFQVGASVFFSGLTSNVAPASIGLGWGTGTNPNGRHTLVASTASVAKFCQALPTGTTLVANSDSYYGHSVQPWNVSTSACTGINCTVTFANPNTCASSCVSATTKIVAGQFDDDIVVWHYGENVPMKTFVAGNNVVICAAASHISPQQFVAFEGDGGLFTKVTTPIDDPWGPGGPWTLAIGGVGTITQPFAAAHRMYCAQAAASAFLRDGQHEIKAIGCATVGYCTELGSVKAIDGSTASSFWKSNSHGKKDWVYQGITNSFDPAFPNYNWATTTSVYAIPDGIPVTFGTITTNGSTMVVPWTIAGVPVIPTQANQTVGITGITATNNICNVIGGTATLPYATLTVQGTCSYPTGSKIDVAGVSNTGSTWNGTKIIVTTGTSGSCVVSCTVTYPALSTGTWNSGGTVKPDLNGNCYVSAATSSQITCTPQLAAAGITASGGTFTNNGGAMCVVGGYGDNPPPWTQFDTTQLPLNSQMTPNSFQMLSPAVAVQTCDLHENHTGCQHDLITHIPPCGVVPTATETVWSWDRDSGKQQGRGGVLKEMPASYFFYTNVNGTIQSRRAYVNSWNPASAASGLCNNASTFPAGSDISTPAYAGAVCNNVSLAYQSLVTPIGGTAGGTVQTVAQLTVGATQCDVFENAANVGTIPLFVGQPITYQAGYDTNSGTDASTGVAMPEFSYYSQYWVVGVGATQTGNANGVTLALYPGGPCINENPALIANTTGGTARLITDISFDEVLFRCDTTLSVPCSPTHPETYIVTNSSIAGIQATANAGWFNLDPDLSFAGTNANTIAILPGGTGPFAGTPELSGRLRRAVSNIDTPFTITPVVTIGPTPPQVTATSATRASCPAGPGSGHQCETINFAAVLDNLKQANGAMFQAPTAGGSPGQSLVISGFTSTTWNCGSSPTSPCLGNNGTLAGIISSTSTSVTFVNDAATGTATGTGLATAVNIVVEAAAGTFAPLCANADGSPINTSGFLYCFFDNPSGSKYGTNQYSQSIQFFPGGTDNTNLPEIIDNSNCFTTDTGAFTYPTLLNHVVTAATGGTTNDLIYLTMTQTAFNPGGATLAINQCTSPLKLANNGYIPAGGFSDLWVDSIQSNGPYFRQPKSNGTGPIGAGYVTNTVISQLASAFSSTSYVWGSRIVYTIDCIGNVETIISTSCVTGQQRIPIAFGGSLYPSGNTWVWITKGWDANGTITTCGGLNCLGDAAHTDQGTATVSFSVPLGFIPPDFSTNWSMSVSCNLVSSTTVGASVALVNNFNNGFNNAATTHAPTEGSITLTSGAGGQCIIPSSSPVSGNPAITWTDADHIDYNFMQFNPDVNTQTIPTAVYSGAGDWQHAKDYIIRNVNCACGTNEQLLTQGMNAWNVAHEEEVALAAEPAVSSFIGTVAGVELNGVGSVINYILRNDQYNTLGRMSPNDQQTIDSLYFINLNGGTNLNFNLSSDDIYSQGFGWASQATLQSYAGAAVAGNGGYPANAAIVPSLTRQVDPATGLPIGPASDPGFNNLLAEPWFGLGSATGDNGQGSW